MTNRKPTFVKGLRFCGGNFTPFSSQFEPLRKQYQCAVLYFFLCIVGFFQSDILIQVRSSFILWKIWCYYACVLANETFPFGCVSWFTHASFIWTKIDLGHRKSHPFEDMPLYALDRHVTDYKWTFTDRSGNNNNHLY